MNMSLFSKGNIQIEERNLIFIFKVDCIINFVTIYDNYDLKRILLHQL